MSARDDILARVRSATSDITTEPRLLARVASSAADEPSLGGGQTGNESGGEQGTLELFVENVADYRATVLRTREPDVAATVVSALRSAGLRSVVLPSGLDGSWCEALGEAFEVVPESEAHSPQALDVIDAVVTGCALGIAATGTIVLDHSGDQGRRELTLVPDTHLCVIRADQVVPDVPEAVARLGAAPHRGQPLTWISGPSATSDIELQRVEGVHGPRTLVVVLVGPD
ncbi:LutC/YkgG family protein [Knoellia sp. Soil729]|uniref:LutC/YkgG family protein n=1 Tax=Knoellia sp. Soil729 TaxID=1736394 RepID=UPI0006F2D31D|nr:lactate utilization protein C [Knoellia sp. Soil729]KRE42946.1 lactate utilization protein C [Knoellia sp. Soil729]